MAGIDWVVVPSIWWENSPLVIQEAFALGRPVICSGIGGMAEKVRDGIDGLHVEPGNAVAWAEALKRAAETPQIWESLARNIRAPVSIDEAAGQYLRLVAEPVPAAKKEAALA
jgi:glycosyltransferase involved in cell wall biosynthesis